MDTPNKPPNHMDILFTDSSPLKYLNNVEIMAFIKKCNSQYCYWDDLKYRPIPENLTPKDVWALIKFVRMQQYKHLSLCALDLNYLLTDWIQFELHILDMDAAGNIESGLEVNNKENRERYIISSLMEEAIASSQLEGAATTRRVAKEMLRSNIKPKNISEQMIANGFSTMQKIRTMKDELLTPELLLELHRSITSNTDLKQEDEGRFRDNNDVVVADPVFIEKIFHKPPAYDLVPELIKELCDFVNTDTEEFIHPIIKGIILHFMIGYIHPFNDGNGRTARTIFYWYFLKKGYWLFEFMSVSRIILRSKKNYGLAYLYTETDEYDLTYFINYNLKCIDESLGDMKKYILRKQKEQNVALQMLRTNPELNSRQAEILKNFIKNSEKRVFIREIMSTWGVVYETARSDLMLLEKLGYVEKIMIKHKLYFRAIKDKILKEL
jgi:Fic family protein